MDQQQNRPDPWTLFVDEAAAVFGGSHAFTDEDVAWLAAAGVTTGSAPQAPAPAAPTGPAPIVGEPAAQGDVLFMPVRGQLPYSAQPITGPVPLVEDGNGHVLTPNPEAVYADTPGAGHVIAVFHVPPGSTVTITQPRGVDAHTPLTLGPGTWQARRQRQQTSPYRSRPVAD